MTNLKATEMLVIDRAMIGFLILAFGIGGSWANTQYTSKANTKAVAANTRYISDEVIKVKLAYIAADTIISSVHSTAFRRLDEDVSDVQKDVSAQAVSIGKIEAGVEYIIDNINGN